MCVFPHPCQLHFFFFFFFFASFSSLFLFFSANLTMSAARCSAQAAASTGRLIFWRILMTWGDWYFSLRPRSAREQRDLGGYYQCWFGSQHQRQPASHATSISKPEGPLLAPEK